MDLMSISRCALVAVVWLSPAAHAAERMPLAGVFIEAKDLTPSEMVQVRRLVRSTGKENWLIYGFRHDNDQTLFSLAALIRASPKGPPVPSGAIPLKSMARWQSPTSVAPTTEWRWDSTLTTIVARRSNSTPATVVS
jgi:hypothetical protein